MHGFKVHGLKVHRLKVHGLKVHRLKVCGLKVHGLKVRGLKVRGIVLKCVTQTRSFTTIGPSLWNAPSLSLLDLAVWISVSISLLSENLCLLFGSLYW